MALKYPLFPVEMENTHIVKLDVRAFTHFYRKLTLSTVQ